MSDKEESREVSAKVIWWVIGIFTTAFMTAGSAWLGSVQTQIRTHGEEIAVIKTVVDGQGRQLTRIDSKLDRLLDRKQAEVKK